MSHDEVHGQVLRPHRLGPLLFSGGTRTQLEPHLKTRRPRDVERFERSVATQIDSLGLENGVGFQMLDGPTRSTPPDPRRAPPPPPARPNLRRARPLRVLAMRVPCVQCSRRICGETGQSVSLPCPLRW